MLSFEFSLPQAEALAKWLLKPAQDGSSAIDDPAIRPVLMKLRAAVDEVNAVLNIRKELEAAGIATRHLSDQQVSQLARRISQVTRGPQTQAEA